MQGQEFSATKWVHIGPFADAGQAAQRVERVMHVPPPPPVTPGCIDLNPMCASAAPWKCNWVHAPLQLVAMLVCGLL
jgi:hypothetical protein